ERAVCMAALGITGIAVFRQKEFVEQPVDLQEAFPVEPHGVALHGQEAPVFQGLERDGEPLAEIDSKLLLEISPADLSQLQLQNEFTNEPFIPAGGQSTVDGKLALLDASNVRLEIVMVLVMRAADVAKAGHS